MRYYDIHTHRDDRRTAKVAILNEVSGKNEHAPQSLRSYGIHPWYIDHAEKQMEELERMAVLPNVVAIGEAGLDKLAATPLDRQREVFLWQARVAEKVQKPLVIHCVRAWAELIACAKEVKPSVPWLIHGFRGNGLLAGQLLRQGFYLSFGERFQQSAVRLAWPHRIFAETDERTIGIDRVYELLAASIPVSVDELSRHIAANFSIFGVGR